MKKAIITLSILCTGILVINPISNTIFAQNTNNKLKQQMLQEVDTNESNKLHISKKEEVKNDKNTVQVINVLNQEQAKELLKITSPSVNYIYQGDEMTFKTLKEKGLKGYVFLPDVDGDIGLFVDKNTSNVYYFHPSGYLELAL